MRLNLLFVVTACVYHGISQRLAIWMTRRISYWFTRWVFGRVAEADLADAWERLYSRIGKDQKVTVEQQNKTLHVATTHCHLYAMCLRYGMPRVIEGFCLGDADYWQERFGDRFRKVTQFMGHGACHSWMRYPWKNEELEDEVERLRAELAAYEVQHDGGGRESLETTLACERRVAHKVIGKLEAEIERLQKRLAMHEAHYEAQDLIVIYNDDGFVTIPKQHYKEEKK